MPSIWISRSRLITKACQPSLRLYSQAAGAFHQRCQIPVRSRGQIDIDINHPPTPPSPSAPRRLVLNLDANPARAHLLSSPNDTGIFSPSESDFWSHVQEEASLLASAANATVITPHYRAGAPWPTPIHDTTAAYDWALANLTNGDALVAFAGMGLGASFALSVGLTESRSEGPRVAGIVASNPVFDWIFEGDPRFVAAREANASENGIGGVDPKTLKKRGSAGPLTEEQADEAHGLGAFRDLVFADASPSALFDPFASPVHLLRTASVALDLQAAPSTGGSELQAHFATLYNQDVAESDAERDDAASKEKAAREQQTQDGEVPSGDGRRFRRALRWPPTGSGIILPPVYIEQFKQSILRPQGDDFIRLLRKAYVRMKVGPLTKGVHQGRLLDDEEDIDEHGEETLAAKVRTAMQEAEASIQLQLKDRDVDSPWHVQDVGGRLGEMLDRD